MCQVTKISMHNHCNEFDDCNTKYSFHLFALIIGVQLQNYLPNL